MNEKRKDDKGTSRDIWIIFAIIVLVSAVGFMLSQQQLAPFKEFFDNVGIVVGLGATIFSALAWYNVRRLNAYFNLTESKEPDVQDKEVVLVISTKPSSMVGQVEQTLRSDKGTYEKLLSGPSLKCKERFLQHGVTIGRFIIDYHNKEATDCGAILTITLAYMDEKDPSAKSIPTDQMEEVVRQFKGVLNYTADCLRESGVERIRLFYGGIGVFYLFVGEEFSNNFKVSIYNFDAGKYYYIGDLRD